MEFVPLCWLSPTLTYTLTIIMSSEAAEFCRQCNMHPPKLSGIFYLESVLLHLDRMKVLHCFHMVVLQLDRSFASCFLFCFGPLFLFFVFFYFAHWRVLETVYLIFIGKSFGRPFIAWILLPHYCFLLSICSGIHKWISALFSFLIYHRWVPFSKNSTICQLHIWLGD